MARFGPVLTAMVTPFDAHGRLDLDGAAALAEWLVGHGSDGLVVTGSTGEAATLTDDEQVEVWRAVRAAVPHRTVIAGSGVNDTRHAVELTAHATKAGMDGVLVVTPYYNRPSQAGLEAHFRTVAAATDLPVLLYDIPIRTGRKIATEVLLRLAAEVPNIVGVKDAAGDAPESARLLSEAPDDFELYVGDDAMTLPLLSVGAVGIISVASHWAGRQLGELFGAWGSGDHDGARRINASLIPSWDFESSADAPNPVPTKAMLRHLGLPAGECRPPMGPTPDGLEERAAALLDALGGID